MQKSKPAFTAVITIGDYSIVSEELYRLILNQMLRQVLKFVWFVVCPSQFYYAQVSSSIQGFQFSFGFK